MFATSRRENPLAIIIVTILTRDGALRLPPSVHMRIASSSIGGDYFIYFCCPAILDPGYKDVVCCLMLLQP